MRRYWGGCILVEDVRTKDGRVIERDAVVWPRAFPLPLVQRNESAQMSLIGTVDQVMRIQNQITAMGTLETDLPEGSRLFVGGDLGNANFDQLIEGGTNTIIFTYGELMVVAVHEESDSCWPEASITIGREVD